jgi:hypothetical protein
MTGGPETYAACQREARAMRGAGAVALQAPSAALRPGPAGGYRVDAGFVRAKPRDGRVYVLFGARPQAVGWIVVDKGRPPAELLKRTVPLDVTPPEA